MSIPPLPPPLSSDDAPATWLATADPQALRAAIATLTTRVSELERERAALAFAADSFGALAVRLNDALRSMRETKMS